MPLVDTLAVRGTPVIRSRVLASFKISKRRDDLNNGSPPKKVRLIDSTFCIKADLRASIAISGERWVDEKLF